MAHTHPPSPHDLLALMQCRQLAATDQERHIVGSLIQAQLGVMAPARPAEAPPAWGLILGLLWSEILAGRFQPPFRMDTEQGQRVLVVRPRHVVNHLRRSEHLRAWRDALLPKQQGGDRWLKKHWTDAGLLLQQPDGAAQPFERTIGGARVGYMVAVLATEAERWHTTFTGTLPPAP